jgi:hypothetical protein
MKYANVCKELVLMSVVIGLLAGSCMTAAVDPVAGIMTGDGEVNAAGQMRGNFVKNALENFKRMIDVQNTAISQARDLNKKQVNKARNSLKNLQKRLDKIESKAAKVN